MNARDYRQFREGCYYHVYNRGNNKDLTFFDDTDYKAFLMRIKILLGKPMSKGAFGIGTRVRVTPFSKEDFSIISYCLMPNHFHLLIRQNGNMGIDQFMLRLLTSYSKYFNIKHERIGNVFQDRFKAKLVDTDEYVMYVSAYIHNNPAEHTIWPYSSFPDYCLTRDGLICDKEFILGYFDGDAEKYKDFVSNLRQTNPKAQQFVFDEED